MLLESTKELQSSLAKYCRDGNLPELEGVIQDRLHNYRRLVFNITWGILVDAYPITFDVLDEEDWRLMVDEFFVKHNAQNPQVWRMPEEFVMFCEKVKYAEKFNKPYLNELLRFEWMEIEVHTMKNEEIADGKELVNILNDTPILNPYMSLEYYKYPVHRLKGDMLLDKKGHYFVLIYRDPKELNVQFIEVKPALASLLENLDNQSNLILAARETEKELGFQQDEISNEYLADTAQNLLDKGIILGFL